MKRDSSQTATRNCGFTNSKPANSVWSSDMRNRRSTGVCGGSFSLVNCESKCDTSRDDFCTVTLTYMNMHLMHRMRHIPHIRHVRHVRHIHSEYQFRSVRRLRLLQAAPVHVLEKRVFANVDFLVRPAAEPLSWIASHQLLTSHIYYLLDSTAYCLCIHSLSKLSLSLEQGKLTKRKCVQLCKQTPIPWRAFADSSHSFP